MEGVNVILNSNTSPEGKSLLLQKNYGYDKDEADLIAQPNTTTDE